MTDEEMARREAILTYGIFDATVGGQAYYNGFRAGLKAGRPQWHKVADGDLPKGDDGFSKNGIHRSIYLKDRYGNLYTGNYFPKDDTHKEDCFAVEFLEWGFQGSRFCAKSQITEWCEIPTFDKE